MNLFSLEKHAGPYETWGTTSALFANGAKTGTRIPGFVIDGQYEYDGGYLLLTSYDCPYEERQECLLMNAEFRQLSNKSIGGWYTTALLARHYPVGDREIELVFLGDHRWRLQLWPSRWPSFRRLRLRPWRMV